MEGTLENNAIKKDNKETYRAPLICFPLSTTSTGVQNYHYHNYGGHFRKNYAIKIDVLGDLVR